MESTPDGSPRPRHDEEIDIVLSYNFEQLSSSAFPEDFAHIHALIFSVRVVL